MTIYQRKSDGLYIGVVDLGRDGSGRRKRRTVSAKTKSEARKKLRALERAMDDGLQLGVTDRTTVEQWLNHWLDHIVSERVRPRTLSGYRATANQRIIPYVGKYRLVALTPTNVRAMNQANVAGEFSRGTVRAAHGILAAALRDAVRDQLIPRNPAEFVDRPKLAQPERQSLTADQVRHFMRVAAAHDDAMITRWAVAFTLGLRQGEALGLTWDRVLFNADPIPLLDLSWALSPLPQVHGCGPANAEGERPCGKKRAAWCPEATFRASADYPHRRLKGSLALTPPKTRKSVRVMPLLGPMAEMLRMHRASTPDNPHGLVWATERGDPIHPNRDAVAWHDALDRAGLPNVPLHAARHTTATLLLEAGVPMYVISQVLGHSSITTTAMYAHVDTSLAASALGNLDALLPAG